MNVRERDALVAVLLGDAAVRHVPAVGRRVRRKLDELQADVDDVAPVGEAVGRLDIDARHHARHRDARVRDAQIPQTGPCLAPHVGCGAVLHRGNAAHQVVVGEAAGEVRPAHVAQAVGAVGVACDAVAVGKVAHQVERERLRPGGGVHPLLHEQADGLLVLLAVGGQRRVVAEEARKREGVRMLYCLGEVHGSLLRCDGAGRAAGRGPHTALQRAAVRRLPC